LETDSKSLHLIVDARCAGILDDPLLIRRFVEEAVLVTGLHIQHLHVQEFSNGSKFGPGVSAIALLSESGMMVHTAPERRTINVDLFSCRAFPTLPIHDLMVQAFGVTEFDRWITLER
jgi:S-adenosylmethionine/arginine decarboxylase-like enzyme